jgi:hypothetical protein
VSTPSDFQSTIDDPKGDRAAQAVASLRGYAYQLYASAIAWLNLQADEALFLEVAKDYSVAARDALRAVEVKDKAAATTIKSEDVLGTLDSYVHLREVNPGRRVSLHFLSTSKIAKERVRKHQAGPDGTLIYWRRAAAGADVAPLRRVLLAADLTARVRTFIVERTDEQLRDDLIRAIHWDCGRPDLDDVVVELQSSVTRYGIERLDCTAGDGERLTSVVVCHLLMTIINNPSRKLTSEDLLQVLSTAAQVSLPRRTFNTLMNGIARQLMSADGEVSVQSGIPDYFVDAEKEIPLPPVLSMRPALAASVLQATLDNGVTILTGATGSGKTLIARLAARQHGRPWFVLDLRNLGAEATVNRLSTALAHSDRLSLAGVIFDDLNEMEDSSVRRALLRVMAALRRRDGACIVTAYRKPSGRALAELGLVDSCHVAVPNLSVEDVADMVTAAGGAGRRWGVPIHHAAGFGFPQLVQALIAGVRSRSWPDSELKGLRAFKGSSDLETERAAARQLLVAAIPEEARSLLYRVSLLLGRFDRATALSVAEMPPAISRPGEQLDSLIGAWIEPVSHGEFRASPLIEMAGKEVLGAVEVQRVHRTAAEHLIGMRKIAVDKANSAFMHALFGKSEWTLAQLAYGVLRSQAPARGHLAEWMVILRLHVFDRPIYPENEPLSAQLRFAQYLLLLEGSDKPRLQECWVTLHRELAQLSNSVVRDRLEYLIVVKTLLSERVPTWNADWFSLIVRFEELSHSNALRRELIGSNTGDSGGPTSSTVGNFVVMQCMWVPTVAILAALFDRIDTLSPQQRDRIFAVVAKTPMSGNLVVNKPWLAESKLPQADWRTNAQLYWRMAHQALSWGYRELALRCHVARAVVLDEYAQDSTAGEQSLIEAEALCGPDRLLDRERAKILFRRGDHRGALPFFRRSSDACDVSDAINQAYLCREAGICAAEVGDWAESLEWFKAGRDGARLSRTAAMRMMAIGLEADAAVAAAKIPDWGAALRGLDSALQSLRSVDPTESIAAGYCHRMVRHAILWLFGLTSGEEVLVEGQPPALIPGMCSNPEPVDWSDAPLGSIDYAQYLLAQAEVASGVPSDIGARLREVLGGRAIPVMEVLIRRQRIEHAVREHNAAALMEGLGPWIDSQVHLESRLKDYRDAGPLNPKYGEIEAASLEELDSGAAVATAQDAILSFGAVAAMAGKPDALTVLANLAREPTPYAIRVRSLVEIMNDSAADIRDLPERIARVISGVARQVDLTPDEVFVAGLRFTQVATNTRLRPVAQRLETWVRAKWSDIVIHQKFRLRNPRSTAHEIETALRSSSTGLPFIAHVLLAAESAVTTELPLTMRNSLRSISASCS